MIFTKRAPGGNVYVIISVVAGWTSGKEFPNRWLCNKNAQCWCQGMLTNLFLWFTVHFIFVLSLHILFYIKKSVWPTLLWFIVSGEQIQKFDVNFVMPNKIFTEEYLDKNSKVYKTLRDELTAPVSCPLCIQCDQKWVVRTERPMCFLHTWA